MGTKKKKPVVRDGLPAAVRGLRRELQKTQEDFAPMLDVTVATIARWEQGRADPTQLGLNALRRLAAQHRLTYLTHRFERMGAN